MWDALALMRCHCNVTPFAVIHKAARSKSSQHDGCWLPRVSCCYPEISYRFSSARDWILSWEFWFKISNRRLHSLVTDTSVSERLENSNPNLAAVGFCDILHKRNLSLIEWRSCWLNKSRADVMLCGITEPSRVCLLINKINTPPKARVEMGNRFSDISYVMGWFALKAPQKGFRSTHTHTI